MAKRFTDTEKWKKPFIKSLQTVYKLFWLYILDNCDHAGIWHIEMDVAEIRMNEKLDIDEAIKQFGDRIIQFDNKTKWFIPDFINFQYGTLREDVKAHKSVIDILKKYKLYAKSLQSVKDKDKDKDKDIKGWYRGQIKLSNNDKNYISFCKFLFENNDTGKPLTQVLNLTEQIDWEKFRLLQRKIEIMREKGYTGTLKQKVVGYINGGYRKKKFFGTMDSWITGDANKLKINLPDNDEIRNWLENEEENRRYGK